MKPEITVDWGSWLFGYAYWTSDWCSQFRVHLGPVEVCWSWYVKGPFTLDKEVSADDE